MPWNIALCIASMCYSSLGLETKILGKGKSLTILLAVGEKVHAHLVKDKLTLTTGQQGTQVDYLMVGSELLIICYLKNSTH